VPARAQTGASSELVARGVQQLDDGDLEGAVATLTTAVRRLSTETPEPRELATAHLHLGVAYALLDQEKAARASFREARQRDSELRLDPGRYPPKVLKLFEEARAQPTPAATTPPLATPSAAPSPSTNLRPALGYLGVNIGPVTEEVRKQRSVPSASGALVLSAEGPAAEAGLRAGDVIRAVDGTEVSTAAQLTTVEMPRRRPGQRVTLSVWRDGKTVDVPVTLGDKLTLLHPQCDQGKAEACLSLAYEYESGHNFPKDSAQAATLARRACDLGSAGGCGLLGWFYLSKEVTGDPMETFQALRRGCDGRDAFGCYNLAYLYLQGTGVAKDLARAASLYEEACGYGAAGACATVGKLAADGNGVPRDLTKATTFLDKACDGGHGEACENLGEWHAEGGVLPRDDARAVALFERGCRAGFAKACLRLARHTGKGIPSAEARAASALAVLSPACDAGNSAACFYVGLLRTGGKGVDKDPREAARVYEKGCESGEPSACTNLGVLYIEGKGVKRDPAQAAVLYRKACEARDSVACSNLASMYLYGNGVVKDKEQALAYFKRACDGGNEKACANHRRLAAGKRF
jgi:hypothetical protein